MGNSEDNEYIDVIIPKDAVEIKVTNIINPYFIRIQEAKCDRVQQTNLYQKLQKIVEKENEAKVNKNYTFKIGDDIIVISNKENNAKIDLPHWFCRGVVTDTSTKISNVFLLDYGISINVSTNSLIKYSRNSVPIEALTYTVGIFNILPMDSNFRISKEWPKDTIDLIKEIFQCSTKIYFQVIATDKETNKMYGDFFLVIKHQNISLSKVLIHSMLAIPLYDELSKTIKKGVTNETLVPYQIKKSNKKFIEASSISQNSTNNSNLFSEKRRLISFKKKEVNEKMLVRSKLESKPLEHLEDAQFTRLIHKALENQGVHAPKFIQAYMWPAISQGFNVIAVGSKASGKCVGYTIPICNYIAINQDAISEKQKNETVTKPVALILCASTNKCIDVTEKCKHILYYYDNVKSFAAFNGITDKQLMVNILNKFHILVSTPAFLLRFIQKYSKKLDFSQLSYLVLDHVDIILSKYFEELMVLIRDYKIINKQNQTAQIIAVAETWTDKISSFVDTLVDDPYICIGSFVEAAAFSKVKGRMLIRQSNKKKQELLEPLQDYKTVKTMIFCIDSDEAIELNNFLQFNSIETQLVHEQLKITQIQDISENWKKCLSGAYPVLICTDQAQSELAVSDIQFLIHYSITSTSKTQFCKRFSVLMDNWILELKMKCKVLILFDETKEYAHFKGVINILRRLNVQLPEDWEEIADRFDLADNIKKKHHPLCNSIKNFGVCRVNSCSYRHRVLGEVDHPMTNIIIGDELKVHVTFIHSATHFSARILEATRKCKLTGNKISIDLPSYDVIKLNIKMKEHYSQQKNKVLKQEISVGAFCALKNPENEFTRVQILHIVEYNTISNKPRIVKIRSIDDGRIEERIYVHDLYEIPEELLQFKFPIIDIFLIGVEPFDKEYLWTDIANMNAAKWFKEKTNVTSFVFVQVLLHIGHTIWTDSIVSRFKPIGYPEIINSRLEDVIKKEGHGIENKNHLTKLLELCYSGDLVEINGHPIDLPNSIESVNASVNECD